MTNPEIPIKVTLALSTARPSLSLEATLHNASASQPLYLLNWSSPLDPRAAALGVFVFTALSTGEEAPGMNLMFRRRTPENGYFEPSDERIVQIDAGESVTTIVEIGGEVMLEPGERYSVKAKGRWMGVWLDEHEKLAYNVDGADVLFGEFESESVEI